MSASETSTKNWYTTFLLCVVFVGIFGAHHFYLGRWKMGALYLWLWPIFLFTLWPRDIYYLWTGKMKDAEGKKMHSYNSWANNVSNKYAETTETTETTEELIERIKLKQREQAVKDMKVVKEEYQEIKGEMKEDIKEFKEENNRILEELKSDLRAIKKTDPDKPLLPVVETQADYDLLKSGDTFIEDGSTYKKP